jgi:hypothetical protein
MRYVLIALLVPASMIAQDSRWVFFPFSQAFRPFVASHEEPHMGLQQHIGNSHLDVAVGAPFEIARYEGETDTVGLGADFFAYAFSRTFGEYRFKIDAADGYFLVNASYKSRSPFSFRFRAIHLSAHLVDGYFDDIQGVWRTDKLPFAFSRNYLEIAAAYDPRIPDLTTRLYGGGSYAVHVRPDNLQRWAALAGAELAYPGNPGLYAAYHLSLKGTPNYTFTHNVEAGAKFGAWNGRGFRLFVSYHNGLNDYGQYYNEWTDYWSVGFWFDLW